VSFHVRLTLGGAFCSWIYLMFQFQGIWFPDGEKHFPEWMKKNGELVDGKGTYQIKKFRAAMEYVKNFRVAVDVGAHVGLWSMQLANKFGTVIAIEPVKQFRDCFKRNISDMSDSDIRLYPLAVGAKRGRVMMSIDSADTGGTHVERMAAEIDDDPSIVEMRTLDFFGLSDLDFLKIDCEGYEHHVIEGAKETLFRCKPCVIVEQKLHKLFPNFGIQGTPAVDMLLEMGAKLRSEIGGDYILSWE
jgi:FkbM family methyltransferase